MKLLMLSNFEEMLGLTQFFVVFLLDFGFCEFEIDFLWLSEMF